MSFALASAQAIEWNEKWDRRALQWHPFFIHFEIGCAARPTLTTIPCHCFTYGRWTNVTRSFVTFHYAHDTPISSMECPATGISYMFFFLFLRVSLPSFSMITFSFKIDLGFSFPLFSLFRAMKCTCEHRWAWPIPNVCKINQFYPQSFIKCNYMLFASLCSYEQFANSLTGVAPLPKERWKIQTETFRALSVDSQRAYV